MIPKEFRIFGQPIRVEWDKDLLNRDDCRGMADYRTNTIKLQPSSETHPLTREQIEKTYWHETLHMILFTLGDIETEGKLRKDECLIDLLSHAIHQILTTRSGVLLTEGGENNGRK